MTESRLSRLKALAPVRETVAVLVAVALSLAIITTIHSNIRSVEQALPRFGFLSFRELHVHVRAVDRLKDMVLLARTDPAGERSRELLAEATDLAYVRFARVDRTRIANELASYSEMRARVLAIIETVDSLLSQPGPFDRVALDKVMVELEEADADLNRLYFSIGEESSRGLFEAQQVLATLNKQILIILAILSSLLIGIAILLVERQRATNNLRQLTWRDTVTDLKNRAWLMEQGPQFISGAKAARRPLAMYLIDLDHFKQVNDTFGHQAGDDLLRTVGDVLMSHDRPDTSVSVRLGGDEFAIMRVARNQAELIDFGELLCRKLSGFREVGGHPVQLAAGIGLSFCPDHGDDVSTLLKHADLALYAAKADGRQRLSVFTEDLKANLDNRIELEETLRKAIRNDEFVLVWQPQLAVASGRLTGAEALVRWNNPRTGTVSSPLEFIPVAEDSDLILEIDRLVMRKACEQAAAWLPHLPPDFTISVNISGRHLSDSSLCTYLAGLLAETRLPASMLELELTERVLIKNKSAALSVLAEIRKMGMRVALDDFGTGYSNLGSIAELEIDRVKIDRSFLSQLGESQRKRGNGELDSYHVPGSGHGSGRRRRGKRRPAGFSRGGGLCLRPGLLHFQTDTGVALHQLSPQPGHCRGETG